MCIGVVNAPKICTKVTLEVIICIFAWGVNRCPASRVFVFFFFPINVLEKCVWRDGEKHGGLQCSELCVSPQWTVLSVFVNSLSIMYTQVNIKVGRATLYFTDIYIYMMNRLEICLNVQYSVLLWPVCSTFTAHLEVTLKTSVLLLVVFVIINP